MIIHARAPTSYTHRTYACAYPSSVGLHCYIHPCLLSLSVERVLIICSLAIKTAHKEGRLRTEAKVSAHGMQGIFNHMTCCLASCCVQKIAIMSLLRYLSKPSSLYCYRLQWALTVYPVGAPVAAWFDNAWPFFHSNAAKHLYIPASRGPKKLINHMTCSLTAVWRDL